MTKKAKPTINTLAIILLSNGDTLRYSDRSRRDILDSLIRDDDSCERDAVSSGDILSITFVEVPNDA